MAADIPVETAAGLRPYTVTIRRFDPAEGPAGGEDFVLPVDSPDEEHAIASTIANAASFSRKADGGRASRRVHGGGGGTAPVEPRGRSRAGDEPGAMRDPYVQ